MTHLFPTTNPIAARVDDDVDDDHTIVVPPEDRCLVVLDGLRTPAEASECHSGISRLGRGLAELVEAQERRPRTPAEACLLRGFEALLGVRELPPPDGLRTPAEAARKLRCSIKTLNGHVASGALRYVNVGHGRERVRRMFADADLNEFIANQTRKDVPCPSTRTETAARRSSISISKSKVIGFMEARSRRRDAKPKK